MAVLFRVREVTVPIETVEQDGHTYTKAILHNGNTVVIVQDPDGNTWHELDGDLISPEEATALGMEYWRTAALEQGAPT